MKVSLQKITTNNIFLFKLIHKATPGLIFAIIIGALIGGFEQLYSKIIFITNIISNIEQGKSFQDIIPVMVFGFLLIILMRTISAIIEHYIKPVYSKKLIKGLESYLYQKAKSFDLSCYDDAEFYNEYIWTTHNAKELVLNAINTMHEFLRYITEIIGTIGIIFTIDASMAMLSLISVIITMAITAKKEKISLNYRKETMTSEKRKKYIERMFYLKDSAKDIRLTNIYTKFEEVYNRAYDEQTKVINKYAYKLARLNFIPIFIFRYVLNTFIIYLYFAYKLLVRKTMLISEFVAVNRAMVDIYLLLTRFTNYINNIYKNTIYIESMKVFLDYQPKIKSIVDALDVPENDFVIEFINVSFNYPGDDKATLKNINLTIHSNKKLAIVGYNGAGKTTLIKLLLRLYDVDSGEILLNGINIKKYNIEQYRRLFGVTFQDFRIFAGTVGENVLMDNVTKEEESNILRALDFADFKDKYNNFHNGLETPLTREFEQDGVLLSGGEKQKIAIARVFSKPSKIAVFDEPSAALDPISEYNIYRNISDLTVDQAVVFISHRLTSTKMADKIIMLEDGQIIEQGTHEQLLSLNGKYAEMFYIQAKHYFSNIV